MYDKASELYNEMLETYLMNVMIYQLLKKKINPKYNPNNIILDTCGYKKWYEEESNDSIIKDNEEELDDLLSMPLLERERLKI